MDRILKASLALLILLAPVTGYSHAGHGTFSGHELWHYLTSPAHILPVSIVMAIIVLVLLKVSFDRKRSRANEK